MREIQAGEKEKDGGMMAEMMDMTYDELREQTASVLAGLLSAVSSDDVCMCTEKGRTGGTAKT